MRVSKGGKGLGKERKVGKRQRVVRKGTKRNEKVRVCDVTMVV